MMHGSGAIKNNFVPQYFEIREVGKTIKRYYFSTITYSLVQRSNMFGGSVVTTLTTQLSSSPASSQAKRKWCLTAKQFTMTKSYNLFSHSFFRYQAGGAGFQFNFVVGKSHQALLT